MGESTFLFESYEDLKQQIGSDKPIKARFVVIRDFKECSEDSNSSKTSEPNIANIFHSGVHAVDSYHLIVESDNQVYALSRPVMVATVAPKYLKDSYHFSGNNLVSRIGKPGMQSLNPFFEDMLAAVVLEHFDELQCIAPVSSIQLHSETVDDLSLQRTRTVNFLNSVDWMPSVDKTVKVYSSPDFLTIAEKYA